MSEGHDADLCNYEIHHPPDGQPLPTTLQDWQAGCNTHYTLPTTGDKIDRYVTHGAGVNIPNEYLGFYYSGLRTPSGGYIQDSINTDNMTPAAGLVKVDMSDMGDAKWYNMTSPGVAGIAARGGAALSWVPFGQMGLLVLAGGVPNPMDIEDNFMPNASTTNLMQQVSVYDVSQDVWYAQPTTGGPPPQLANFCAVVAHEENTTSYQIYMYGGFDGAAAQSSNAVWILSVPSFHWTQVLFPADHPGGRYGHVCAMPYPDQMLVVGGLGTLEAPWLPGGEIVQVLNLSSLQWLAGYDPQVWSAYHIPDVVKSQDPSTPAAGMDATLATLFTVSQPNSAVVWTTYKRHSNGKNRLLVPILAGVLGGVAVAITGALIWWFLRDRKGGKSQQDPGSEPEMTETQETTAQDPVDQWRHQVKSIASSGALEIDTSDRSTVNNDQAPSVVEIGGRTHLYSPRSPRSSGLFAHGRTPQSPQSGSVEVNGDPLFRQEMQDTSPASKPVGHDPSRAPRPEYQNIRSHPLYPLNVSDSMSVSEPGLVHGQSQYPVHEANGNSTRMSHRAEPVGNNDLQQYIYGGPLSVAPKQPLASTSETVDTRHVSSRSRMPPTKTYPGNALPSTTAREMPTGATFSEGLRTFYVMPAEMGVASPVTRGSSSFPQSHPPIHQRNISDETTATLQILPWSPSASISSPQKTIDALQ